MIYFQTKLIVSDNSGAHVVKCIKTLLGQKKKSIIGDTILVTIKKLKKYAKIKKKKIYFGLIIRTKKNIFRSNGTFISFDQNNIIFVSKENEPIYNRIKGHIVKEFRKKKKKKYKNFIFSKKYYLIL
jgi:large subunit ribosomal protein L14